MFEMVGLVLAACAVLLLVRIASALERLSDPPEEEGPFDYYAAEQKAQKRGRSGLFRANKDLRLPEDEHTNR